MMKSRSVIEKGGLNFDECNEKNIGSLVDLSKFDFMPVSQGTIRKCLLGVIMLLLNQSKNIKKFLLV